MTTTAATELMGYFKKRKHTSTSQGVGVMEPGRPSRTQEDGLWGEFFPALQDGPLPCDTAAVLRRNFLLFLPFISQPRGACCNEWTVFQPGGFFERCQQWLLCDHTVMREGWRPAAASPGCRISGLVWSMSVLAIQIRYWSQLPWCEPRAPLRGIGLSCSTLKPGNIVAYFWYFSCVNSSNIYNVLIISKGRKKVVQSIYWFSCIYAELYHTFLVCAKKSKKVINLTRSEQRASVDMRAACYLFLHH